MGYNMFCYLRQCLKLSVYKYCNATDYGLETEFSTIGSGSVMSF